MGSLVSVDFETAKREAIARAVAYAARQNTLTYEEFVREYELHGRELTRIRREINDTWNQENSGRNTAV